MIATVARILRWIIIGLTIAAAPSTVLHGWYLLNHGTEREASEYGVAVGFCVFFITLGLKLLGQKIDPDDD